MIELNKEFSFVKISSIEKLEDFDDEYVYDLEIDTDDENLQSFFANDLLVHNSAYITFNDIRKALEFEGSENELILELNKDLQPHLNKCFKEYADEFNLKESFLDFELENISNKGIWLAKKKYILNLTYKDGIIYDEPKKKFTGIEVIQRSTPKIARKLITDSIDWLIKKEHYNLKESLEYMKLIRELKKEFKYCSLEDKCLSTSINDYKKFIIDDVNELVVGKGCPIHVRAAGHYNYLLHKSGLGNKYEKIGNGSKVKWYFTKDNGVYGVFGFVSGSFPTEFAPEIDLGAQFNRTILGPIDRIGSVTGLEPVLNGGTIIRAGKVLDNVEK